MADITTWWKICSNFLFFACFVLQMSERTKTLFQSPWSWAVTQTQSGHWGVNLSLIEGFWTSFWFPGERNTHLYPCSLSHFSICACWDDAWTCCSHLAILRWKKIEAWGQSTFILRKAKQKNRKALVLVGLISKYLLPGLVLSSPYMSVLFKPLLVSVIPDWFKPQVRTLRMKLSLVTYGIIQKLKHG